MVRKKSFTFKYNCIKKIMKLEFMVINLVILLGIGGNNRYVWSYQGPQGVKFTYKPSTSFYEGQPFEFTCDAGTGNSTSYKDALPINKPESIYLKFFSKDSGTYKTKGCQYKGDPREASVRSGPQISQWNNLTSDECGNRDQKLDKITITGNITKAMQREYSNFSCIANYRIVGYNTFKYNNYPVIKYSKHQETLNTIPDLKLAPQNLTLSLSDVVEEGKRFNFSCESVGAKPSSRYTYKVQRVSGKVFLDLNDTSYEPIRPDREGINISCTDKTHINFPGSKSNIIKWMLLMPQYVEFKDSIGKEIVKTISLEKSTAPPFIHLSCDIFISSKGLGYVWYFNGLELTEKKDKVAINLTTSDIKYGDKADCKVGFAGGQASKQYSWIFRKQLPWLPIVLGLVAVVAVVVVAFSLLLFYKYHSHQAYQ